MRAGVDSYLIKGISEDNSFDFYDNFFGVFAPIGIHQSWAINNKKSSFGFFVEFLDLGNLISQGDDIYVSQNGIDGVISADVDSNLENSFSPGIYFTLSPSKKWPLTIGFGGSVGPKGKYRTFTRSDGEMFDVGREWSASAFLSVDVVIFSLR